MGRFSQKGLCYTFEILQGLLSNKTIRIPMKIKFRGHRQAPQKADFGWTEAKMGYFSRKGLCYSFETLQGLLSNKTIWISLKIKFWGPPQAPPKSSFGIFHGLLSNKNIRNPMKKIFGGSPLYPQLSLF